MPSNEYPVHGSATDLRMVGSARAATPEPARSAEPGTAPDGDSEDTALRRRGDAHAAPRGAAGPGIVGATGHRAGAAAA